MHKARLAMREKVKGAKQNGRLKKFVYMEEKPGIGTSRVYCKCGQTIQELREVPEMSEVQKLSGRTIVRERVALMPSASYSELEITFDDGSKHITPMCKGCAKKAHSTDFLDDVYAADMGRWEQEESRGLGAVRWDLLSDRKAVSAREVTYDERFTE